MLAPEEKLKLATKPYLATTARFANGADTPRDFLERCLADLAALEPKIGAFVHLNLEGARAAADHSTRRWPEGRQRSPIDGMPLGIKDIIETADMPTENGSPLFAGWRSERDGASVAALREAGAVIVGKTVTTEFAATEPRGTRNPHDLRRTRHPGDRLDHPPSQLLRLHRLQGERRRAQPWRQLRWIEPERHGRARRDLGGRLASRLRDRRSRWRRSWLSWAVRAGQRAGTSQAAPPRLSRDGGLRRRLDGREGGHGRRVGADQIRRDRARNKPIACQGRRRRRCDQRSACAVDANQCLGMALAAQHLSRAGREKAQPGIA